MQSSLDLDWKTLFGAESEEAREFAPQALEGLCSRAVHSGTLVVLGPRGGKDFSFEIDVAF